MANIESTHRIATASVIGTAVPRGPRGDSLTVRPSELPTVCVLSAVVLHEEVFLELTLFNTSSSLCTFKVKTTARDRYLLRPTQDYIPAGGSKVCKIVMSALRAYPDLSNPKNLKDKFLVQATNIAGEVPDLTKFVRLAARISAAATPRCHSSSN